MTSRVLALLREALGERVDTGAAALDEARADTSGHLNPGKAFTP